MKRFALCVLIAALAACSADPCREYSDYTCAELQTGSYNVYYSEPTRTGEWGETYLGEAQGLDACGAVAYDFAAVRHKLETPADWSYICCLRTDDSECAEKHR